MGQTHADREAEIGHKFLGAGDPNSASYHFLAAVEMEPEKAEHHFWLGSSYCAEEKFRDAEKPLRDALRIEPNYAEALVLLGKCAVNSGHLASAEHYFQLARDLELETTDPFEEGMSFYRQGRFAQAEKCFRVALGTDSDNADLHCWCGRALHSQGRLIEAESSFKESLNINPHNGQYQWWFRLTKDAIAAKENLGLAQDFLPLSLAQLEPGILLSDERRFNEAENFFRELSISNPKDAVCHWWLGLVLRNQRRPVEAERSFAEAVRLNPNNAVHHWWLGRSLEDLALTTPAESHFQEATRLKPDNSASHWWSSRSLPDENLAVAQSQSSPKNEITSWIPHQFETGKSLHNRGYFVDAEVCFREMVRLNPNDVGSHHWLGRALSDQSRFVDAEVYFREAVRLNPNDAANHHWLGNSLYSRGCFVEAEMRFREAVRLKPNDAANQHWLGRALSDQGRFGESAACFREAVRLNPKDAAHHYWLGISLNGQCRPGVALASCRQALHMDPENAEYHHWVGVTLCALGRFAEAERSSREAIRLNPKVADYHHWLGWARQSLRSFVEAQTSFREAVRLDPENTVYAQYLGVGQHQDSVEPPDSGPKDGMPRSFVEFLLQGKFWLEKSNWNVAGKSSLLQGLYEANCSWADPAFILFEGYGVSDDFLDESLARAESLSKNLHLQPSMPTFLETSELSIAMTIEGVFLRAWVGKNQKGVAVAVNLTTWELHYPLGDIDGAFAVGAALNWFLDRSLAHPNHPHFRGDGGSAWKVSTGFYEDISNISAGVYPQPLKAHQVRGFIRTLEKGKPTDESRDNAPSYIRRHMGPNDTWVRPHNRGQGESAEKLVTHLTKFSSLADFLATAPRS
jgi:tetratricopeptide (TPR) repeat protein